MEQSPTAEKLVTARDVAAAMGMAVSQVYRLAKQKKISSYVVGENFGGVRFDLREVKESLRRPATSASEKATK